MKFLENALLAPVYFAGLFDGEGSVGLYMTGKSGSSGKIGGYVNLTAKVTNSVKSPLTYLFEQRGGSIENNKASQKQVNWMDTYSWRVYSDNAYDFLQWIYPYTIIKKEQIEVVQDFWDYYKQFRQNKYNRPDSKRIEEYINTLKQLKRGN